MELKYTKHTMQFIKPAKTSKIDYQEKDILILKAHLGNKTIESECAPLPHLSVESIDDCQTILDQTPSLPNDYKTAMSAIAHFPSSLHFAIESIFLAQQMNNKPVNTSPIKINGLIWMNGFEAMQEELFQKVRLGFDCIKIKIGQHDFDAECRFLELARKRFGDKIEIRLDANGAFAEDDALQKLKELSRFQIHSIEQPIKEKQWEAMEMICKDSKIAVALDEELIGIDPANQLPLLKKIKPQYLILKPSLHGGFKHCDSWIKKAATQDVNWWATSALESNIGLYHLALWLSQYHITLPQGLGTGSLFKENFKRDFYYDKDRFCWV